MHPRLLALLALVLPLFLGSCEIDTINKFDAKPAQVRFANFLAEPSSIDVRSNNVTLWPAVGSEGLTTYSDFDAEKRSFVLRLTGATTDLTQADYVLNGDQRYTMIAIGTVANPSLLMTPDSTAEPGSSNYRVRILHLAPTWTAVDVYIAAPGADIANLSPNVSAILYGSTGVFKNYNPGDYQIRVTEAGTKNVIYDSGTLSLAGNRVVNAIVYTRGSGTLVNMALMETTGDATMQIANSSVARMRAVNLAPGAGSLNLLADQSVLFRDLVYATAASYTSLAPGSHVFTVEAAGAPGATAAQFTKTLVPATDTSVYVGGSPGALVATPLDDNNVPSLSGQTRLRFVNLMADATTFDALFDTTVIASAVTTAATPGYVGTNPGTFTLNLRNTATGTTMLSRTGFAVGGATVYTLYVGGTAAAPTLLAVQDR